MAIFRRSRFGALPSYGTQIPIASVSYQPETGSYSAYSYGISGGADEGDAIVFRNDAGSITYWAAKTQTSAQINASLLYNAAAAMNAGQMTQAPIFQQAWLSQNPSYAEYWRRYGAWPVNDPAAQSQWFMRAAIGGMLTVDQQSSVAQSGGWQNFFNQTFPVLATSFVVGSFAAIPGYTEAGTVFGWSPQIGSVTLPYGYQYKSEPTPDYYQSYPDYGY